MNYAALVQAIQDYTENDEPSFVANIPVFVQQTEQRIYNEVQLPSSYQNVLGNMTASNPYLTLPSDFLSPRSVAVIDGEGQYSYLLNKDVNFIREAYPNPTETGKPVHYALFEEDTFLLGPTPDANYSVELHYFGYPESIVTAGTSWLGDNYDPVLLYGSLHEAYTYMKGEPDLLKKYEQMFLVALAQLKNLVDGKKRRDVYRVPQFTTPPT